MLRPTFPQSLDLFPELLARVLGRMPESQVRIRPRRGGFSLVEHLWHLADLEREAFGARIDSLLTERNPFLPDFDGERLARERAYQTRDPAEGLARFAESRGANLRRLRVAHENDWDRVGDQEAVGPIRLADMPKRMADHDASHTEEVRGLLKEIDPAHEGLAELVTARAPTSNPPSR